MGSRGASRKTGKEEAANRWAAAGGESPGPSDASGTVERRGWDAVDRGSGGRGAMAENEIAAGPAGAAAAAVVVVAD
jgi:hypothetical protein